jgi:hypothetical protein
MLKEFERCHPFMRQAPHLRTPEGAIYFLNISGGIPEAFLKQPFFHRDPGSGCAMEVRIGKAASHLFEWAQQFGNNHRN